MKITKIRLRKRYKLLLFTIVITFILFTYIRYIEPNQLMVKEYKIESKNLPSNFHGTKIIHISDVHYGRTINKKQLENIIKEINKLRPDIVVFTGDLIDKDVTLTNKMTNELINELSKITVSIGKYAVYGNHDKYFSSYSDILDKSNFLLLDNNYDLIYNKGYNPIYIGGINTNKKVDYTEFTKYFDDNKPNTNYKIMLMHEPDYTDNLLESYNVDLILAGHSHNGQIKLPYIKPLFLPKGAKKYYKPYYKINNTDLYISSGLGTSVMNIRLFNKPSFNLYRLTKSK